MIQVCILFFLGSIPFGNKDKKFRTYGIYGVYFPSLVQFPYEIRIKNFEIKISGGILSFLCKILLENK